MYLETLQATQKPVTMEQRIQEYEVQRELLDMDQSKLPVMIKRNRQWLSKTNDVKLLKEPTLESQDHLSVSNIIEWDTAHRELISFQKH